MKGIPKEIREYADVALRVTTKIKQVLDSGIVVTITDITPTDIDNNVREQLSRCIGILNQWLAVQTLQEAIEKLREYDPKLRNAVLIKLASEITACLDNNTLKESDYDVAVQASYSGSKLA